MKKIIYYIASIFLGLILSFLLHGAIEIIYINYSLGEGVVPEPSATGHLCFLPFYLQVILPLAGIVGGYFFGRWGWRVVYEEK